MTPSTSNKLANLSFLCACLVVTIHVGHPKIAGSATWWTDLSLHAVSRIAVPLFFAISGYLLAGRIDEKGWWTAALKKRLRTIGLPFVLWLLVSHLFKLTAVVSVNGLKVLGLNLLAPLV